ncbi:hypothetical protein RBB50_006756 [Rhinocladiella similis]
MQLPDQGAPRPSSANEDVSLSREASGPPVFQPLTIASIAPIMQTPTNQVDSVQDIVESMSTDLFDHYDWSMVFQDDNFADIFDPVVFSDPTGHSLSHPQSSLSVNLPPATPAIHPGQYTQQGPVAASDKSDISRFGSRLPSLEPEEQQYPTNSSRSHHSSPWAPGNPKRARLEVSIECRQIVLVKLAEFADVVPRGFELPSRHALNRFLALYITGFNEHNPILHLPTTSLESIAVELFLSIVSIGARYAHEKEICFDLLQAAQAIVFERIKRWEDRRKTPTATRRTATDLTSVASDVEDPTDWLHVQVMQALVLMTGNIVFGRSPGAGSRESALFRATLGVMIREVAVSGAKHGNVDESWDKWVKAETLKRIVLVAFTLFNLQTMLLDIAPSLWWSEVSLDLPCSEETWNATCPDMWHRTRRRAPAEASVQDAMADLFHEETQQAGRRPLFSSLGGYFLIHAILQSMWIQRQMAVIQANRDATQSLNDEQTEGALRRWRQGWEQNEESSMNPVNPSGPIAFTSTALLRLAYVRLTTSARIIPSLTTFDHDLIAAQFLQTPKVMRSERATRAALHCAHALSIPVKIGLNFVAHTQSFYWACQHALSSLECVLFLSKWLETVTTPELQKTLSPQEGLVLEFVVQIVRETGFRAPRAELLSDNHRLSRIVVEIWGKVFPEVGVWEIVDLIAKVYKACATNAGG